MSFADKLAEIGTEMDNMLSEMRTLIKYLRSRIDSLTKGEEWKIESDQSSERRRRFVDEPQPVEETRATPQEASPAPLTSITPKKPIVSDLHDVFIHGGFITRTDAKPVSVLCVPDKHNREYINVTAFAIVDSFFEQENLSENVLTFDRIDVCATGRYGIFAAARDSENKPVIDKATVTITIRDSIFRKSDMAVPLRFNEGTAVYMENVTALQETDETGTNCCAARFHGYITAASDCVFGWTKIGPQDHGMNDPFSTTLRAHFIDTDFVDGFRLTRGLREFRLVGVKRRCKVLLHRNAADKGDLGSVTDIKTVVLFENVDFVGPGRLHFPNCKVIYRHSTYNGNPCEGG